MKPVLALAVSAALTIPATGALAQVQTITAKPGTVGSDGRKVKEKDGRICRVLVITGSRMPKNKVCKTAEQWQQQEYDAKYELDTQIRLNSTMNRIPNAGGGR